jgi:hypothetical protein
MASGETSVYDLPYPLLSDPVNVASDIQSLAERLESVLPTIGLPYHTIEVTNSIGTSINKTDPVYISGFNSTTGKPIISKSTSETLSSFPVLGLAQSAIGSGSDGVVVISGVFTNVNTSSYTVGSRLYVGSSGGLTTTQPDNSGVIGVVAKSDTTNGIIIVGVFKGNGTWGSLKAGLA